MVIRDLGFGSQLDCVTSALVSALSILDSGDSVEWYSVEHVTERLHILVGSKSQSYNRNQDRGRGRGGVLMSHDCDFCEPETNICSMDTLDTPDTQIPRIPISILIPILLEFRQTLS